MAIPTRGSTQILPRLRRAQRDSTCAPTATRITTKRIPRALPLIMDTRRWGPGERLVFEPYTKEAHNETFDWIARHGIFADTGMGHGRYEDSVLSLAAE